MTNGDDGRGVMPSHPSLVCWLRPDCQPLGLSGDCVSLGYSGGEKSHLPELPFQGESCVERVKYVAGVNKLKKSFDDVDFEKKDTWQDPVWGVPGDRIEKEYDETRDATLTIHYFDSEDGVCRTAFASVSNQIHECREHSIETAWKFISQFKKEN